MQFKKIILLSFIFALFGCSSDFEVLKHEAIEKRQGRKDRLLSKLDTVYKRKEAILYISKINGVLERRFIISKEQYSNDSKVKWRTLKNIRNKKFICNEQSFLVYKYSFDDLSSSDEESYKYYCEKLGIFLETFWRENTIETISLNDNHENDLKCLIQSVKSDYSFYN